MVLKVTNKIDITEIYDKNLNFLIGAGASSGLFPTLSIALEEWKYSFEELYQEISKLNDDNSEASKSLLFMHYYQEIIKPVQEFKLPIDSFDEDGKQVVKNYTNWLKTILLILRKKSKNKICNIFTTNYDGCIPFTADELMSEGGYDFILNDGTSGFFTKKLEARNYNKYHSRTGMFSEFKEQIPTINLLYLHGSAYWKKSGDNIEVAYRVDDGNIDIHKSTADVTEILNDRNKTYQDLIDYIDEGNRPSSEEQKQFWSKYEKLPIVNPTKWKFNETVFEEHYYQMLRNLSYELEKKQTVFIAFGFSFADEHILKLVKRSLSNPSLHLYICCFGKSDIDKMNALFSEPNVELVAIDKEFTGSDFKVLQIDGWPGDDSDFGNYDFYEINQKIESEKDLKNYQQTIDDEKIINAYKKLNFTVFNKEVFTLETLTQLEDISKQGNQP